MHDGCYILVYLIFDTLIFDLKNSKISSISLLNDDCKEIIAINHAKLFDGTGSQSFCIFTDFLTGLKDFYRS